MYDTVVHCPGDSGRGRAEVRLSGDGGRGARRRCRDKVSDGCEAVEFCEAAGAVMPRGGDCEARRRAGVGCGRRGAERPRIGNTRADGVFPTRGQVTRMARVTK